MVSADHCAMTTTAPTPADRELMEVMRNLNLAMALVAKARDQGCAEQAIAAQVYLRQADEILVRLAGKPAAPLTVEAR